MTPAIALTIGVSRVDALSPAALVAQIEATITAYRVRGAGQA